MELTTYTELEIAHRLLTSYAQKCRSWHGHRYEVEITVASQSGLNADGMIVDFKKLKEVVKEVLDDKWDHGACLRRDDPLARSLMEDTHHERVHLIDANPTLEWMVAHWVEELNAAFKKEPLDLTVTKLKASETAKNTVTWTPEKLRWRPLTTKASGAAESTAMEKNDLMDDNPDAVPYLVAYRDCFGMYSKVVYSSLAGKELVDYCQAAVTPIGKTAVVVGISRLPGLSNLPG